MLHRHDFATATRRAPLPRRADPRPLSPSRYLILRRKAAGLSVHDLAQRMATLYLATQPRNPDEHLSHVVGTMLLVVQALELRGATARRPATIDAIAAVMPFDAAVYWQLAHTGPDRHPRICRGCGASTHDDAPVAWATKTSCTRCDPAGDGM
ncbi:hypothetical protein ASE70_05540 [Sphingomonas sp. Leaf22]|uniref:hypothetical protein n=1 Tax=Sphingomonas sp. Leaf22 TaxID=1735687 RepID=UPI0006FF7C80|nr:hypothetical protein [Sphingomonas sp. Leaf22]KQM79332.1 hypothetical protein ASE70_05540 [Sphingomonas sp. Leaf22]